MKNSLTFLLLLILMACQKNERQVFATLEEDENVFILENKTFYPVKFKLLLNNTFPIDKTVIIKELQDIQQNTNETPEMVAFKYAVNNTFHSTPYSSKVWQHNPFLFLNSIGGGFCDDRSSVLAKLWSFQGFDSRVIGLEGHVVPEVLSQNEWKMMDPDLNIIYYDQNKRVLSVNDIEKGATFYYNNDTFFNPAFKTDSPISRFFLNFYSSKEDNGDQTEWHLDYPNVNSVFVLPSFSKLYLYVNKSNGVLNVKVELSKKSEGLLKIPLVPYQAKGSFDFEINSNTILKCEDFYQFSSDSLISNINIRKVNRNSYIDYLVNPKLNIIKEDNNLLLSGTNKIQVRKETKDYKSDIYFGRDALFFDLEERNQYDFIKYMTEQVYDSIDDMYLMNLFEAFLQRDVSLCEEDRGEYLLELRNHIEMFNNYPINVYSLLEETYPISVLKLFIAVRYGKLEELKRTLSDRLVN